MKQFAILAVMMTFVINPVFARCHAANSQIEQSDSQNTDRANSGQGCHEVLPSDVEEKNHNPKAPMDCSGCAECDAYYQKANEVALKVAAADLPGADKILAFESVLQVDAALWMSARLRPPGLAPPVVSTPVQLKNILIL